MYLAKITRQDGKHVFSKCTTFGCIITLYKLEIGIINCSDNEMKKHNRLSGKNYT